MPFNVLHRTIWCGQDGDSAKRSIEFHESFGLEIFFDILIISHLSLLRQARWPSHPSRPPAGEKSVSSEDLVFRRLIAAQGIDCRAGDADPFTALGAIRISDACEYPHRSSAIAEQDNCPGTDVLTASQRNEPVVKSV
jgi:hypothetical protein